MDRLGQRQLGREVVAKMPSCALFVLRGVLLFRGRFSSWNAFCALNALFGAKRIFSYTLEKRLNKALFAQNAAAATGGK
jgi:hypothetical protein